MAFADTFKALSDPVLERDPAAFEEGENVGRGDRRVF